jgi:hypothetical protein
VNPYIPAQGIGLFRQWIKLHIVLVVVALALTLYQLYFERLSAYAVWFIIAAVNGITAGKWGAGESYFATAIAASCILTGIVLARFINWAFTSKSTRFSVAVVFLISFLLLFQANQFFHLPTHTAGLKKIASVLGKPTESYIAPQTSCSSPRPPEAVPYVDSAGVGLLGNPPKEQDTNNGIAIANKILEGKTAAFSEEAGFNLYVGKDVVTNPTQLLNLYNNNEVDLSEMLDMLDKRQFDTVIFRAQFYPPPVLEVIGKRYRTTDLIEMNGFVYCVLRPDMRLETGGDG